MRMYAYPDYDDHVQDHEAMTEFLNDIMKTVTAGKDSYGIKNGQRYASISGFTYQHAG